MITENYNHLILSLEKIAKSTGEDEDDNIHLLEQEFQVFIDKNEILDLRGSAIWIYITKPCNSIIYQSVRDKFMSLLPLALIPEDLLRKYVKKVNMNGKSYVKYPERVEIWQIYESINQDLGEDHEFPIEKLSESEWAKIYCSPEWKKAEVQVAREIIAANLIECLRDAK